MGRHIGVSGNCSLGHRSPPVRLSIFDTRDAAALSLRKRQRKTSSLEKRKEQWNCQRSERKKWAKAKERNETNVR